MLNCISEAEMTCLAYEPFMWGPMAILPYIGIKTSTKLFSNIDKIIRRFKVFNWLFVNQYIIAKKL
jgi:hypothetical protein